MTGFGSASLDRRGLRTTVEARSVNNRHLKVTIRASPVLSAYESSIEELARERFRRGTVNLSVSIRREVPAVTLNLAAAREYAGKLRSLGRELRIPGEPDIALLASLPGVLEVPEAEGALPEEDFAVVREAIDAAFGKLSRMRDREGANLKRDLAKRARTVGSLVKSIRARAPGVREEYMARLRERVQRLVRDAGVEVPDRDLLRELAIFAERSDIAEELTRLQSHLDQFRIALSEEGEVGRRLDFLVQEMAREANTASAKSGDTEISKFCVDMKVELDRLKEQVQNVE
jgi:uncharacterized protein (TIGR00255 family)